MQDHEREEREQRRRDRQALKELIAVSALPILYGAAVIACAVALVARGIGEGR